MDEVIRDLVVLGLIASLCFVGAAEYVYWRFGFDRIVDHLRLIQDNTMAMRVHLNNLVNSAYGRKVA